MNNEYTFIENIYEILKLTMNDIMIEISVNSILLKYLQIDDMLELKLYHTFIEDIYEYILESKMNNVMISIMTEISVNSLLLGYLQIDILELKLYK